MKQVIVSIRDCSVNSIKTVDKTYFYSVAQYKDTIEDFCKTLMPGQEIYVKVGNTYSSFISYEEVMEDAQTDNIDFDKELRNKLLNNYSLNYYMKEYLED